MERYSFEKARDEADKMQAKIESGDAENYADAEKLVAKQANTYAEAPVEWKEFYTSFKNLQKEVLGKIFKTSKEKQVTYLKRIKDKENESFSSVSDPNKYVAWHISLAGSTGPISSPKLDFEGDFSLLKFYQNLSHELDEPKKEITAYDSHPADYVEGQRRFFAENPDAEKPIKLMLDELKPFLLNADIADIGCGDGKNLDFYLTSGAEHVNLIDPAKNILEVGREKVKTDNTLSGRADFQIGDFENNGLKDESMDVVVSGFSMHYNTDMDAAFAGAYKKLKKGGRFFIVAPHPDDRLNQEVFNKNGKEYIRINLYGSFVVEYPTHKMEEYFSDFVKTNFDIIENKTFTYDDLGLEHKKSNNAVLYVQLQKK